MNKKLIFFVAISLAATLAWWLSTNQATYTKPNTSTQEHKTGQPSDNTVKIVSTKPEPLEEAVISATEQIEITFSHPLENEDQFKNRMEPGVDYKIVLSQDKKTAKIIPQEPYGLGTTYTLFILPDSKFEGIGEWKQEKIFHFQTIKYRGV